ncbi:MAG: hypothetical protein V4722_12950 [Bacteroidota bacterium]
MKHLTLLMISVLFISFAFAQTPSEKLFKKYADKEGVELSVTSQPPVKDSITNAVITSVIKIMTISNDSDKKNIAELFKSAIKDCKKLLNSKKYSTMHQEKDDEETFKVCKYAKNGTVEMCVLELDNDELTLTSTQISGLTEEAMKKINLNYSK